jgi:outer membrane protein assembly factor BamE (lipoprotein component of BamABCDE complex)
MMRQFLLRSLTFVAAAGALVLTSCSTVESRISDHPEIYQSLSPRDQELVRDGQIQVGMPESAVWLAWGSPQLKAPGAMRGRSTETWVYTSTTTYPYPYYGGWGPYGYGGLGFGFTGVVRTHHHRSFVFFGDPFFDPFYYSYIPPSITYPYKVVTFANGRVISYQYLVPPYW